MSLFKNHRASIEAAEANAVRDRSIVDPPGVGVTVLEKSVPLSKPLAAVDTGLMTAEHLADYRATCERIGVNPQDIVVEEFRHFLAAKDIPTFEIGTVISYMDELVAKDNPTGFGWHWCAVRPRDSEIAMTWGKPSEYRPGQSFGRERIEDYKVPASDFYQSHGFHDHRKMFWSGGAVTAQALKPVPTASEIMQAEIDGEFERRANIRSFWNSPSPAYTRTLPLHALKKIALIESEFKERVVFLVTEYTTHAQVTVNPDPFLMAVIPNSAVSHGKGRFIIDVWDEPGFGIERMLK